MKYSLFYLLNHPVEGYLGAKYLINWQDMHLPRLVCLVSSVLFLLVSLLSAVGWRFWFRESGTQESLPVAAITADSASFERRYECQQSRSRERLCSLCVLMCLLEFFNLRRVARLAECFGRIIDCSRWHGFLCAELFLFT